MKKSTNAGLALENMHLKERIKELEDLLDEFADAPGCMHVPDWIVIKCEQALKGGK